MDYILHGFGVFLGVLAGVAVTILVQWIVRKLHISQLKENLRFEFEFDNKKLDAWLKEIETLRQAVYGDTLNTYYGYFDLSKAVLGTAHRMFADGLLYSFLSHEDIERFLMLAMDFSLYAENYLNNQIDHNKRLYTGAAEANDSDGVKFVNQEILRIAEFWETKFKDHKKTLNDFISKLK